MLAHPIACLAKKRISSEVRVRAVQNITGTPSRFNFLKSLARGSRVSFSILFQVASLNHSLRINRPFSSRGVRCSELIRVPSRSKINTVFKIVSLFVFLIYSYKRIFTKLQAQNGL